MYFCTNLVGTLDAGLRDRVEVAGGGLDAGQFVEARRAAARQQFGNLSRRSGSGGASVAVGVDPARRRCWSRRCHPAGHALQLRDLSVLEGAKTGAVRVDSEAKPRGDNEPILRIAPGNTGGIGRRGVNSNALTAENYKRSGSSARAARHLPLPSRPGRPPRPYHYWTRKARGQTVGLKLTRRTRPLPGVDREQP